MIENLCECTHWARTEQFVFTKHHRNCPRYNPEKEAYDIISALIDCIIIWASDEDGIHPSCIQAFRNAANFIGTSNPIQE